MESDAVITSRGLSKRFRSAASLADLLRGRLRGGRVDVLRGVDMELRRGEVAALMGKNGAGKSTLLRLLAGLLIPDGGTLAVLGREGARLDLRLRQQVCYVVADERSFSWRLTGRQNLEFFAALFGLSGAQRHRRVERSLEVVGLADAAARPVREYSSGMRQRLSLARGFLGRPQIFLLDEPTRGLDPDSARDLRAFVRDQVLGPDVSAVVATHDEAEAEALCDRVMKLQDGRLRNAERGTRNAERSAEHEGGWP